MRRIPIIAFAAGVVILLAFAVVLPEYRLGVLAVVAMFAIASLAQNLLAGYADVPSLGNVAFFAVSAYTAGSLITLANSPAIIALPIGVLAAGFLGLIIGLPALRISGMALAVVTLVLVFAGQEIMAGWDQNHQIPSGLPVNQPDWLLQERGIYVASIVLAAVAYLAAWNLLRGSAGRAIIALSDNPYAAAVVGISAIRYRLGVFVLSGTITGAAGITYLYYTHTVTPATFPIDLSLAFLTMTILGGSRSLGGSLLGAVIIGLLPQALDLFPSSIGQVRVADIGPGLYALLLLATLRFFPDGIWNTASRNIRDSYTHRAGFQGQRSPDDPPSNSL